MTFTCTNHWKGFTCGNLFDACASFKRRLQVMINLSMADPEHNLRPRLTVMGVGGAGGNAINNMIRCNLEGCDFIGANTDSQALAMSLAGRKIQLGINMS